MISFNLSSGGRALVPVYLKPFDLVTLNDILFKVDTGADITAIDKKDLYLLGYTHDWIETNARQDEIRTLSRAGGRHRSAWYVNIPICNFAGRDLINWPFYIRMEADRNFPNLLGLDVLSNYVFTFNYDKAVVVFEPAANPQIVLPRFEDQEISELRGE